MMNKPAVYSATLKLLMSISFWLFAFDVDAQIVKELSSFRNSYWAERRVKNVEVYWKNRFDKELIARHELDSDGYLIHFDTLIRTHSGNLRKTRDVTYSSDRRIVTDSLNDGTLNGSVVTVMEFRSDGKLVNEVTRTAAGEQVQRRFHYNASGYCDTIYRYDNGEGEVEFFFDIYTYGEVTHIDQVSPVIPEIRQEYNLTNDGRLLFHKSMQQEITCVYDSSNRITEQTTYFFNGPSYFDGGKEINSYLVHFFYDKNGLSRTEEYSCFRTINMDGSITYSKVGRKSAAKYMYTALGLLSKRGERTFYKYTVYN